MGSFTSIRLHIVFSTKNRGRFLTAEIRPRLWPYLAALAKEFGMIPLKIGGFEDHVHLLVIVPATEKLSDLMSRLKANSSRWIRETFALRNFGWQDGYAAFSVSVTSSEAVARYVATQEEHHGRRDFNSELQALLHQHGGGDR